MNNPYCLILSGSSGSGKSTTAKKLWTRLDGHPAYLNLDSIKHFLHGATATDYFLDLARINALSLTENYLKAGHPVILDKAFGSYNYVSPFIDLANRIRVPSYYFKLTAPLDILIKRAQARRTLSLKEKVELREWPLPAGSDETVTNIHEFFEKNKHTEGIEIDTIANSPEQVIEIICSYLPDCP